LGPAETSFETITERAGHLSRQDHRAGERKNQKRQPEERIKRRQHGQAVIADEADDHPQQHDIARRVEPAIPYAPPKRFHSQKQDGGRQYRNASDDTRRRAPHYPGDPKALSLHKPWG